MPSQKIKAFTLVELIIVITILAILRTIGFMSYGSYTQDARDGKRKTDLREIRKGLEIYQLKNQILPKPEEQLLTIKTGSLIVLSYQGYLGKEIQKTLRLTSETKDSKDNNYYTYSTNGNQTKYQLLAMLENNPNNISLNNEILNKAFSLDYTNRYSYSLGNKLGIFLSGTTNEPLQETLTGVDLSGTTPTYKIVFNTTSGNITSSGSDLYTQIINNQGTGGTATQTNSCTTQPSYTNAIFTIGTPTSVGQAWQGTTSTGACYYTCGTGKVLVGNDCVSENCSGTTPDGIAKVSNALTFAGGTWNYNTSGGLCTYSCGTGYHTEDSGLTCISNTKSCTITNGVGSQTWNTGTSTWGTCNITSCNTGYTNVSNVCTKIGSTSTAPGLSCKDILDKGVSNGDGTYWIKPDSNRAFQVYCDMTTDGGGWTVFLKVFAGPRTTQPKSLADGSNAGFVWNDTINYEWSDSLSNSYFISYKKFDILTNTNTSLLIGRKNSSNNWEKLSKMLNFDYNSTINEYTKISAQGCSDIIGSYCGVVRSIKNSALSNFFRFTGPGNPKNNGACDTTGDISWYHQYSNCGGVNPWGRRQSSKFNQVSDFNNRNTQVSDGSIWYMLK